MLTLKYIIQFLAALIFAIIVVTIFFIIAFDDKEWPYVLLKIALVMIGVVLGIIVFCYLMNLI
jgi:hypothetical protein